MHEKPRTKPPAEAIRAAILPLKLIFWCGLACLVDISTNSGVIDGYGRRHGFRFDFLNDALATTLIAFACFRLAQLDIHERYATAMRFVYVVACLAVVVAIDAHFTRPRSELVSIALDLCSIVAFVAILVFTVAMRWCCEASGLAEAGRSWRTTTILFVLLLGVPWALLQLAGRVAGAIPDSAALLVLAVFAIPIVHLFVSTWRMERDLKTLLPARAGSAMAAARVG